MEEKTVLVLGASGGIGGEVARVLKDGGWSVRALRRGLRQDEVRDGIHWLGGDALVREDVLRAARGCAVIVHAVNPPGYRGWAETVLPMIDHSIAAARRQSATLVLPGTVYNYGPDAFPLIAEDAPQHPTTRKGAIRVELERRLRAATADGACRAIVLRAGDFFGPRARNSWFSQGLVRPGRPVTTLRLPGRAAHQWAYLPDVAATMALLIERRARLEPFARFHLRGHWDEDGTRMARAIDTVVRRRGGQAPRVTDFPWWLTALAAPFSETLRELREMRYLWRQPVRMNNARLLSVIGAEPHTPWEEAVEATLAGMGCLESGAAAPAAPAL